MHRLSLLLLLAACPSPDDTGVETDTGVDTDTDVPCDEVTVYDDLDLDGYGDPASEEVTCFPGDEQIDRAGDCDDTRQDINPDATEICNDGLDNDCDGRAPACRPEGTSALTDHASVLVDTEDSEGFGSDVALVPDVDGDGRADVLIARPLDDRFLRPGAGAALLFTGVDTLDGAEPTTIFRRRDDNANAGAAVLGVGDWDGDGNNDLVISAPRVSFGDSEDVGQVHVVLGPFAAGEVLLADVGIALDGGARKDQAGRALAAPGDLTGDGRPDVAVAAPQPTGDKPGRVYLIPGGASSGELMERAVSEIVGGDADQRTGEILAAVGDLDGDGVGELVVGGGARTGAETRLWWFADLAAGTVDVADADASLNGGLAVTLQQGVVDGAGDVDGDGYDDLWVGAPAVADVGDPNGAVYLFLGAPDAGWSLGAADGILRGGGEVLGVGASVAGAGDLDGDGLPDAVVSAQPLSGTDAALLIYGGLQGVVSSADAVLTGEASARRLGQSLDAGLDVQGDGRPDVLLGAPGFGGFGRAYLLPGGGF